MSNCSTCLSQVWWGLKACHRVQWNRCPRWARPCEWWMKITSEDLSKRTSKLIVNVSRCSSKMRRNEQIKKNKSWRNNCTWRRWTLTTNFIDSIWSTCTMTRYKLRSRRREKMRSSIVRRWGRWSMLRRLSIRRHERRPHTCEHDRCTHKLGSDRNMS